MNNKETNKKNKININTKTKRLVLSALFMALCCVGTLLHVPAGPSFGYLHLGDAFVLLSGFILGPLSGACAASIGSIFADIINGYAIYVPATFIIKGLEAFLVAYLYKKINKKIKANTPKLLLSGVIALFGEFIMVVLYYVYDVILLLLAEGEMNSLINAMIVTLTTVPYNLIQSAFGILIAIILLPFLKRISKEM